MYNLEINYSFEDQYINRRLDIFLAEKTGLSRSQIRLNIKEKRISVNNKIAEKAGLPLKQNDIISGFLCLLPEKDEDILPEDIEIDIIYEDKDLIVLNKPADLIVHPTDYLKEGTLVNALLYKYAKELSDLDESRPGIIHRLDKDTTGLMLVAKNNIAHAHLSKQLAQRTLKRTYWAVVDGLLSANEGSICASIGRNPRDRKKMAVLPENYVKSRYALTEWELLEEFQKHSLVKINLQTGRTHQIRVHFSYIKHPVLGDPTYGNKHSRNILINRQCLHAKEIRFIHPTKEKEMHFECELPDDFKEVLKVLGSNFIQKPISEVS